VLSRSFVAGLIAVAVPAGAVGAMLAVSGGGTADPLPVNTVQGAPGDLGPPIAGAARTQPLSRTPSLPPARPAVRDYGMDTDEGNQAVDLLVEQIRKALRDRRLENAAGVEAALEFGIATISDRGFAEVHSAPVLAAIARALERDIRAAGIDPASVVLG
jgi:hypothetical protein